jgi:hypothetical protein
LKEHGWLAARYKGGYMVCPGDWIVKESIGNVYACKDYVFKATYELVDSVEIDDVKDRCRMCVQLFVCDDIIIGGCNGFLHLDDKVDVVKVKYKS